MSGIVHYCGQTAGWMKTPLGTEVDLGAGHIVLDSLPALRERGTAALPSFLSMSIVACTVVHLSYCWALVSHCTIVCGSVEMRFLSRFSMFRQIKVISGNRGLRCTLLLDAYAHMLYENLCHSWNWYDHWPELNLQIRCKTVLVMVATVTVSGYTRWPS